MQDSQNHIELLSVEEAVARLNNAIKLGNCIVCMVQIIELKNQPKRKKIVPISEIKKIGKFISTQQMFTEYELQNGIEQVYGVSILIDKNFKFKKTYINESKSIFQYKSFQFILFH